MAIRIINSCIFDGLSQLEDESVHCVVTSPPYWGLRSYLPKDHPDKAKEIGQEPTLAEHIDVLVRVFREVRRVLRRDGTLWLNYGDAYNSSNGFHRGKSYVDGGVPRVSEYPDRIGSGLKPKDLLMMPSRLAIALQDDGWWVRSRVIWHKPNPMPESVTDRPTSSYEEVLMLTRSERYFYDSEAVKEPETMKPQMRNIPHEANLSAKVHGQPLHRRPEGGTGGGTRNLRNVWTIATSPFAEAHFATFPPDLVEICVKAGTSERGCCSECGAPWLRVVERTGEIDASAKGSRFDKGKTRARDGGDRTQAGERYKREAKGWKPSCKCGADTVPCTVLDTFGGSGTTGMVADRLQRNAILIDLSDGYVEMAERRVKNDCPLFTSVSVGELAI